MVDPSLNWIFDIIGGSDWPQGDEDKLRALADEWDAVAAQVQAVGVGVPALTNKVTGSVGGTVGRHFFRYGQQLSGFEGDLASMAGQQAQMLRNQALNVENAKYSMIIQLAFTAAEILWAIADPFTMPLVPEFLAEGLAMMRALRARFGQGMHLILEAVDEGAEEIFQDLLAQLIQIGEGNRHGIDGQSVAMSAAFGAGAGAFAHVVKGQLQKYSPKFAGSWKGAATVEGVTELGVGAVSIPLGGDPGGLGWSVLNGGLSGAASHGAHKLGKNLHEAYTGAGKPGPDGPAGDGKANLPGVESLAGPDGSPGSGLSGGMGGGDAENPSPTFVAAPPYSAAVAGADGGLLDAAPPAYTPVAGVDSPRVTGPPVVGATAGGAGSGAGGSSGAVTRESTAAGDSPVPTTNARPPAVSGEATTNGEALAAPPHSYNATPDNITTAHSATSSHLANNGGGIPNVHTSNTSNNNTDLSSSPDTSPTGLSTSAAVDAHPAASNSGLTDFTTSIVATTHATDVPLSTTDPLATPSPAVSENPTSQAHLDVTGQPTTSLAFTPSPLSPTASPTAGADRALTASTGSVASGSTSPVGENRHRTPDRVMNPALPVASPVTTSSLGQAGTSTVANSGSTNALQSSTKFLDATSQLGSSVSPPRTVERGLPTASLGSANISPISAEGGSRRSVSTPEPPTAGSIRTSTDVATEPAKPDIAQASPKEPDRPVSLAVDGGQVQQLSVPSSDSAKDSKFYSDLANDVNLELAKASGWEGGAVTRDAVERAVDANRSAWSYQPKNSRELAWHIAHYFVTAGTQNRPRLDGGAVGDELETGVELDLGNEQADETAIVLSNKYFGIQVDAFKDRYIAEIVAFPSKVHAGEVDYLEAEAIDAATNEAHDRLLEAKPGTLLTDLFPVAEGFDHHETGGSVRIAEPSPGFERNRKYVQYSVGVPLVGIHAAMRMAHDKALPRLREERRDIRRAMAFGDSVAAGFIGARASAGPGDTGAFEYDQSLSDRLERLKGDEEVSSLRGVAAVAFSHAYALIRSRTDLSDSHGISKNLLLLIMRTDLSVLRESLPPRVQDYLEANSSTFLAQLEDHVRAIATPERRDEIAAKIGSWPGKPGDLLDIRLTDPHRAPFTIGTYFSNAFRPMLPEDHVDQREALGVGTVFDYMDDHEGNLELGQAVVEFRYLGVARPTRQERFQNGRLLADFSRNLYQQALEARSSVIDAEINEDYRIELDFSSNDVVVSLGQRSRLENLAAYIAQQSIRHRVAQDGLLPKVLVEYSRNSSMNRQRASAVEIVLKDLLENKHLPARGVRDMLVTYLKVPFTAGLGVGMEVTVRAEFADDLSAPLSAMVVEDAGAALITLPSGGSSTWADLVKTADNAAGKLPPVRRRRYLNQASGIMISRIQSLGVARERANSDEARAIELDDQIRTVIAHRLELDKGREDEARQLAEIIRDVFDLPKPSPLFSRGGRVLASGGSPSGSSIASVASRTSIPGRFDSLAGGATPRGDRIGSSRWLSTQGSAGDPSVREGSSWSGSASTDISSWDDRYKQDLLVRVNDLLLKSPRWDGGVIELSAVVSAVRARAEVLSYRAKNIEELSRDVAQFVESQGREFLRRARGGVAWNPDDDLNGLSSDDDGSDSELAFTGSHNVGQSPVGEGPSGMSAPPDATTLSGRGQRTLSSRIEVEGLIEVAPSARAIRELGAFAARPWHQGPADLEIPWSRGETLFLLTVDQVDHLHVLLAQNHNVHATLGGVWDWVDTVLHRTLSGQEIHRLHRDYDRIQRQETRQASRARVTEGVSSSEATFMAALGKLEVRLSEAGVRLLPDLGVQVDGVAVGELLAEISQGKRKKRISGKLSDELHRVGYGWIAPDRRKGRIADAEYASALESLKVLPSVNGLRGLPSVSEMVNGIPVGMLLYNLSRGSRKSIRPALAESLRKANFGYLVLKVRVEDPTDADYARALNLLEVLPFVDGRRPLPPVGEVVAGVPVGKLLHDLEGGRRKAIDPVLAEKLKEVQYESLIPKSKPKRPMNKRKVIEQKRVNDNDFAEALGLLKLPSLVNGVRPLPSWGVAVNGIKIGNILHRLSGGQKKKVTPAFADILREVGYERLIPGYAKDFSESAHSEIAADGNPVFQSLRRATKRRPTELDSRLGEPQPNRPRRDDAIVGTVPEPTDPGHVMRNAQDLVLTDLPTVQLRGVVRSGLMPVEVPRDGDCLMNSLIVTAGLTGTDGRPVAPRVVRQSLAAALRADLDLAPASRRLWSVEFEVYVLNTLGYQKTDIGLTVEQRENIISLMATSGMYNNVAGDIAPIVAANLYGLNIQVHSSNGRSYSLGAVNGQDAQQVDLIRLDAEHSGVDHWMGTAPLSPAVDSALATGWYPATAAGELQSVMRDLAEVSPHLDGGLAELAALLVVARREIDPMLVMLGGAEMTTAEIIRFLSRTIVREFESGLDLSATWAGTLGQIIAQRAAESGQLQRDRGAGASSGFDGLAQDIDEAMDHQGDLPDIDSVGGAPDRATGGTRFYGGPSVAKSEAGLAGQEVSDGFGVSPTVGTEARFERVGSTLKRSSGDREVSPDDDAADAKRARPTAAAGEVVPSMPGSVEDAVFAIAKSAPLHLRQDEARPWVFSAQQNVYSRERFQGDSLGAINFIQERYQDLVGSNSVHFHAGDVAYMMNCVNVSVGVVERLSGRRFVPAPAAGPRDSSLLEKHFGVKVRDARDPDHIVDMLRRAGPGSHGIVFTDRPGVSGHVFNAFHEAADDSIVFLDAQSGRLASVSAGYSYRFLLTSGTGNGTASDTGLRPAVAPPAPHDSAHPRQLNSKRLETISEEPIDSDLDRQSEHGDSAISSVEPTLMSDADLVGDSLVGLLARAIDSESLDELAELDSGTWSDEADDTLPSIRIGGDGREIVDALAAWERADYDVRFLGQLERVSRQVAGRSLQDVVPDIAERWLAGRFRHVVGVRRDLPAATDLIDRISDSPRALAALLSQILGAPAGVPRDVVKNPGKHGVPRGLSDHSLVGLLAAAVEVGSLDGLAEMDTDWLWDDGASPNLPQVRLGGEHDEILEELASWDNADYDPRTLGYLERSSRQHHGRSLRDVVPDIAERWLAGRFRYLVDTGGDVVDTIDRLSNRPKVLSAIASRLQKTPVSTQWPAQHSADSRLPHAVSGEVDVFLEYQNGRRDTGYQRAAVLAAARRLGEAAVEARKLGHRLAVTFTTHSAGPDGGQGIGVAVVNAGRAGRLIATELNALSTEWDFSLNDIVVREGTVVPGNLSGVSVSTQFIGVARIEAKGRTPIAIASRDDVASFVLGSHDSTDTDGDWLIALPSSESVGTLHPSTRVPVKPGDVSKFGVVDRSEVPAPGPVRDRKRKYEDEELDTRAVRRHPEVGLRTDPGSTEDKLRKVPVAEVHTPWVFRSERKVYWKELYPPNSLEAIAFFRDNYGTFLNINSVRYNADEPGYVQNCVNVAVSAAEMFSGRRIAPFSSERGSASDLEGYFGGKFTRVSDPDKIINLLTTPGSHGIVARSPLKQGDLGHVFNVIHDVRDGSIAFLDVQGGQLASVPKNARYFFLSTSESVAGSSAAAIDNVSVNRAEIIEEIGASRSGRESRRPVWRGPETTVSPPQEWTGWGPDRVASIHFDKRLHVVPDEQTEAISRVADDVVALAIGLSPDSGARRAEVRVVGYGNGGMFAHADKAGRDRAKAVHGQLRDAIVRGIARNPQAAAHGLTIDSIILQYASAGSGGPQEKSGRALRRADILLAAAVTSTNHEVITGPMRFLDDLPPLLETTAGFIRRQGNRIKLGTVLPPPSWWRGYIDPRHHADAAALGDPGSLYDGQLSPGFQKAMEGAHRKVLDGDLIAVEELNWVVYEELHRLVTDDSSGNFGRNGPNFFGGHPLGVPTPHLDTVFENFGGRPLLGAAGDAGLRRPFTVYTNPLHGPVRVNTQYDKDEIPALVDEMFSRFRVEVGNAETDYARLVAIGRVVRNLHILHPFHDGNGRLNVNLLLPRLMMEYGFMPVVGGNDRVREFIGQQLEHLFSGGYSLHRIATALWYGQHNPSNSPDATARHVQW